MYIDIVGMIVSRWSVCQPSLLSRCSLIMGNFKAPYALSYHFFILKPDLDQTALLTQDIFKQKNAFKLRIVLCKVGNTANQNGNVSKLCRL